MGAIKINRSMITKETWPDFWGKSLNWDSIHNGNELKYLRVSMSKHHIMGYPIIWFNELFKDKDSFDDVYIYGIYHHWCFEENNIEDYDYIVHENRDFRTKLKDEHYGNLNAYRSEIMDELEAKYGDKLRAIMFFRDEARDINNNILIILAK